MHISMWNECFRINVSGFAKTFCVHFWEELEAAVLNSFPGRERAAPAPQQVIGADHCQMTVATRCSSPVFAVIKYRPQTERGPERSCRINTQGS